MKSPICADNQEQGYSQERACQEEHSGPVITESNRRNRKKIYRNNTQTNKWNCITL